MRDMCPDHLDYEELPCEVSEMHFFTYIYFE